MNRKHIDTLITYLMAIKHFAKHLHYNCSGENFYSNHLFADRFIIDFDEYIDQLKETCLLSHHFSPLHPDVYLKEAAELIPINSDFNSMLILMVDTLCFIENIPHLSRGSEDLIGTIAKDIQNNVGLLNIMFGETKK